VVGHITPTISAIWDTGDRGGGGGWPEEKVNEIPSPSIAGCGGAMPVIPAVWEVLGRKIEIQSVTLSKG
jgi:hypothetical protein